MLEGGDAPSITDEIRAKMSKAMMGNKNGAHPCKEETKLKISQAQIGKVVSAETRLHQSIAAKNRLRKPCSEETKKKISDKHNKKQVICLDTNEIFESIQDAGRKTNIVATCICKVCKGKLKSAKGLRFSYLEDYNNEVNNENIKDR